MNRSKTNSDNIFHPDNSRTLVEYKTCKPRNIDKKKMTLNSDVTNGKLVVNFRPTQGGSRLDLEAQFLECLLLGTQAMENPLGANKSKSRLFFNRSSAHVFNLSAKPHYLTNAGHALSWVSSPNFEQLSPVITPAGFTKNN